MLWENVLGKSCGKILWENLAGKYCRKILWKNLAGNLEGNLVGNLVGNLTRNWQRLLLEPGLLICTRDRTGEFPVGEIDRPQVAAIVVAK